MPQSPMSPEPRGREGGRGPRTESDKALSFLARLATEFTTVLSLPDLLEHVLRVLREETGFDSCSIALVNDWNANALTIRAASGIRSHYRGLLIPQGKGLDGAVMAMGTPLLVPDMAADPRTLRRDDTIRSGIYTPLSVHGHAIGVLSAHRSEPNAFTGADLNLLTIVARYLAGAIEVARLHEQLKNLAATDGLTGLANRRSFLDRLNAEIIRHRRTGEFLSIALLDLNGFRRINDTRGHAVGDGALIAVAQVLTRSIRASDFAARFGGDEFALVLPDTRRGEAEEIIDRGGITRISIPDGVGGELVMTLSLGIATWPDDGADSESLLYLADSRRHAAKHPPRRA